MNRRQFFDQHAARYDGCPDERFAAFIASRVLPLITLKKNHPVLDIGCGTGTLLPRLRALAGPRSSVTGVDFSARMLDRARAAHGTSFRLVRASAHDLPFPTAAFNTVVSVNAFSHFPDKPAALAEMRRVLADGGHLNIAHTGSRRAVNARHRRIGPPVANDTIPDDAALLAMLHKAGFARATILDGKDIHFIHARAPRSHEAPRPSSRTKRRVPCARCCHCGGCAGGLL